MEGSFHYNHFYRTVVVSAFTNKVVLMNVKCKMVTLAVVEVVSVTLASYPAFFFMLE